MILSFWYFRKNPMKTHFKSPKCEGMRGWLNGHSTFFKVKVIRKFNPNTVSLGSRTSLASNDLAVWFFKISNNWPRCVFTNQNDPMDVLEWMLALRNVSNCPRMEAGLTRSRFWSNRHWHLVTQLHVGYSEWLLFVTIWDDLFHSIDDWGVTWHLRHHGW